MADLRLINLAKTLVHYSTEVKPGDHVGILTQPVALPLAEEVYRQALRLVGIRMSCLEGCAHAPRRKRWSISSSRRGMMIRSSTSIVLTKWCVRNSM